MTHQRIIVTGPASVAFAAAGVLAARWGGGGREVVACPDQIEEGAEQLLLRPSHDRVHDLLGLSVADLQREAAGQLLFALPVEANGRAIALPFSGFGLSHLGVDFHHFWKRGDDLGQLPDLTEFSLALALDGKLSTEGLDGLEKLPLKLGLRVNRSRYASALRRRISAAGIAIVPSAKLYGLDADVILSCADQQGKGSFTDDAIRTATGEPFPGLEWGLAVNAAFRLAALPEAVGASLPERSEFNRLAEIECERLEDMRELLSSSNPHESERPALRRKINVFQACGRIPMEDFEVFQQPEWLAALWARGIKPRRADRMAEIMPEAELQQWLSALHKQVGQIAAAGGAA